MSAFQNNTLKFQFFLQKKVFFLQKKDEKKKKKICFLTYFCNKGFIMISEQDECMIFKNVLQTIGLHKEQFLSLPLTW